MNLAVKNVLLSVTLLVFASAAHPEDFAGPAKCRTCHKDEYTQWKDSPHALAFSDRFQKVWKEVGSEFSCLVCHATGADKQAETFSHPGVTCESCHGVMSLGHARKDAEMPLPVTSEVCRDCHKRSYQEWQMSQHGQNGIRCFDCHGVHAQTLRANGGDQLCGACHAKRLEDFAHATHQQEGLHCNTCHMPVTAAPEDVIGGAGAAGHTLFVGAEVCGRCHADMVHSSAQLTEMREQLIEAAQAETLTGGKSALDLYEENSTLTWKLDNARQKVWTASVVVLVVGLLLGWMSGWYVFGKKRRQ